MSQGQGKETETQHLKKNTQRLHQLDLKMIKIKSVENKPHKSNYKVEL